MSARIEPWGRDDLPLLERLVGDPAMMDHLGGPESPEKIAERQARYIEPAQPGEGRSFRIVDTASGQAVGWVGYWERAWRERQVYEIGWAVIPPFQGRGLAAAATAQAIDRARDERTQRFLHAFPLLGNDASNAICRKLGFTLVGASAFEYPAGHPVTVNDWRLDLLGSPT